MTETLSKCADWQTFVRLINVVVGLALASALRPGLVVDSRAILVDNLGRLTLVALISEDCLFNSNSWQELTQRQSRSCVDGNAVLSLTREEHEFSHDVVIELAELSFGLILTSRLEHGGQFGGISPQKWKDII